MTENKHVASSSDTSSTEAVPDIEQQRADVAETVAALADKADVPARVRNEASLQAGKATAAVQDNPQILAAALGAVATAVVVTVVLRRRRARTFLR
jgi:hypothetical protein